MNLAAALRDAQKQKTSTTAEPQAEPAELAESLPLHPPIGPCGCDGTGWRPIAARTLAGGAIERMTRCNCWLARHPRPIPKPRRTRARAIRPSRPLTSGRDRQCPDD